MKGFGVPFKGQRVGAHAVYWVAVIRGRRLVGVERVVMGLGRLLQSMEGSYGEMREDFSGLVLGEIKERGRRWICSSYGANGAWGTEG
jgi:hypothetical protein